MGCHFLQTMCEGTSYAHVLGGNFGRPPKRKSRLPSQVDACSLAAPEQKIQISKTSVKCSCVAFAKLLGCVERVCFDLCSNSIMMVCMLIGPTIFPKTCGKQQQHQQAFWVWDDSVRLLWGLPTDSKVWDRLIPLQSSKCPQTENPPKPVTHLVAPCG